MTASAWILPIAGLMVAPLVTWLPMLAQRVPGLGLPPYRPGIGIDLWQAQTLWCAGLGTIALLVGVRDRCLGLAVAMAGALIFWRGASIDPTHSVFLALGALMLVAVRSMPVRVRPTVQSFIIASAVFQCLYALQQRVLNYDILWGPLVGGTLVERSQMLGTLGTVDALGAYLAITAPLMPLWFLPIVGVTVWLTHSVAAFAALAIGLLVQHRHRLVLSVPIALASVGALVALMRMKALDTLVNRAVIWDFGLTYAMGRDPILGVGLGGWQHEIAPAQVRAVLPSGEMFREAHSEPIQWIAEAGLVGAGLLGLWLWQHRQMFRHPLYGGALSAGAVNALGFFPLHVVATGLLLLVLTGLATADTEPAVAITPTGG